MKRTKPQAVDRRAFLKTSVVVGAGVAVSTFLPGTAAAEGGDRTGTCDGKQKGYQLSRHVADYYRAAKL